MTEEEMKEEIDSFIEEIEEKDSARGLPDEYLEQNGHMTRKEMGIGEYAYGIITIPADWIYPYLIKLSTGITREKDKDKLIQKQQEEIEKKDKIIDLMAEKLAKHYLSYPKKCRLKEKSIKCDKFENCTECVKQYFKNKVEEEE